MNLGLEAGPAVDRLIAALRERAEAARLWQEQEIARARTLFLPGEGADEVTILLRGLVKLVYVTERGEAWIKSFIIDRGVFSGADAGRAEYGAESVERCRIVRLPRGFVARAAAEVPEVSAAQAEFLAWVGARKQAREAALLTLSAEERYRAVRDHAPGVLARLPQGDVARFLGITPVAFSRIKRRLAGG